MNRNFLIFFLLVLFLIPMGNSKSAPTLVNSILDCFTPVSGNLYASCGCCEGTHRKKKKEKVEEPATAKPEEAKDEDEEDEDDGLTSEKKKADKPKEANSEEEEKEKPEESPSDEPSASEKPSSSVEKVSAPSSSKIFSCTKCGLMTNSSGSCPKCNIPLSGD